ncbi:MAG: ankyrin repeat domain-containing protein [Lentisphaeraceae bacterium]|nr:ankyrin repeat domain-containing protein [Lentisphaeraceae bacterium]
MKSTKLNSKNLQIILALLIICIGIYFFFFKSTTTKINLDADESTELKPQKYLDSKAIITLEHDETPQNLELSASKGDVKRIKELLKSGLDADTVNQYGYTALMSAANYNKLEAAKILVEAGANLNKKQTSGATGYTPLMWAVMSGKGDVVKYLLDKGAEIDVKDKRFGETALLLSSYNYNPEATKLLLDNGADFKLSADNKISPLQVASSRGFHKTVKLLLDAGADVNYVSNDRSVLMSGIESEDQETVRLLIEAGADVNYINNLASYPLADAIYYGNLDTVKLLVENGADVNLTNEHQFTPLIAACNRGYFDIARYLINNGANVNVVSRKNISPLGEAIDANELKFVQLLIERGANINVKDSRQMTPLFNAVSNNDFELLKLLVENGADVNAVSKYGTLIGRALVKKTDVKILNFLLDSGSDFNKKSQSGKSGLDLLVFASNQQKELLLKRGVIQVENCFLKHKNSYVFNDEFLVYCIEVGNTETFIKLFNFIKEQKLIDQISVRELKKLSFKQSNNKIYAYLDKFDSTKFTLDVRDVVKMDAPALLKHSINPHFISDIKTKREVAWSLFMKSLGPNLMEVLPKIIENLDKNKALYEVIKLQDMAALKFLVNKGADINWNNGGNSYPAIIYAMKELKERKILDYIFSLGPDFNVGGRRFRNALQAAGEYQNYYAFKKIRESGQEVTLNIESNFNSIRNGQPAYYEMYNYYQSLGCNYTQKATLYLAKHIVLHKSNNEEELKEFLQSESSKSIQEYILNELVPNFFTDKHFSEKKANVFRDYFIPNGYRFPINSDPLLRNLGNSGECLNYLFDNNIGSKSAGFIKAKDKNFAPFLYLMVKEKTSFALSLKSLKQVLVHAVRQGDVDIVKYLRSQFPDHVSDLSVVKSIIYLNNFKYYLSIKSQYSEVFDIHENELVYTSIKSSNLKVLNDLINKENIEEFTKMKVLIKDEKGNFKQVKELRSPLMFAVESQKMEVVKFLLNKGANINGVTDTRETAYTLACKNGFLEIMELLSKYGANIQIKMRYPDSPWIVAMDEYKGLEIIKSLFKHGLSKDISDFRGNNPLHIAFMKDKPKIAKYLLEIGISYLKANDDGKIAEELVKVKGKCERVLKEFKNKKG